MNYKDAQGYTPMLSAAIHRRDDIIALLKDAGAHEAGVNEWRMTEAASKGDIETIKRIVESGTSINSENLWGQTPLSAAIHPSQPGIVEGLLLFGADPDRKNSRNGATPLMGAASSGDLHTLTLLLNAKVNLEHGNQDGRTALMFAAASGKPQIVTKLVESGASINKTDINGYTALAQSFPYMGEFNKGHLEVARYLLQQGADVQLKTNSTLTLMDLAVRTGSLEAVKLVQAQGVALGSYSEHLFGEAIREKNAPRVELFMEAGFDKKAKEDFRWFEAAIREGAPHLVRIFLKSGVNAKGKDQYGTDMLTHAVSAGNLEIVRALTEAGAEPKKSHLVQAAEYGQVAIVQLFQSLGLY
ncbi:ankyrin repeat domain-containing protein [bacterium]|nr:ankyrin repeat domain-containing protein [bacterium]